jgi:hypothetical protein
VTVNVVDGARGVAVASVVAHSDRGTVSVAHDGLGIDKFTSGAGSCPTAYHTEVMMGYHFPERGVVSHASKGSQGSGSTGSHRG